MSRHASCGRRTSTWTRGELVRRSTARCLLCGRLVRVPLCDANWASVTRPPLRRDGVYSSRQANQPRHHACDSYSEYARMSPAAVFSPSRASAMSKLFHCSILCRLYSHSVSSESRLGLRIQRVRAEEVTLARPSISTACTSKYNCRA